MAGRLTVQLFLLVVQGKDGLKSFARVSGPSIECRSPRRPPVSGRSPGGGDSSRGSSVREAVHQS